MSKQGFKAIPRIMNQKIVVKEKLMHAQCSIKLLGIMKDNIKISKSNIFVKVNYQCTILYNRR